MVVFMGLTYEKMNGNVNKPMPANEKAILYSGDFPNCKGLYPDCPEKPSFLDNKCRTCPKTDAVEKPKLDWVDCEHCGEDGVPVYVDSKISEIEDTKCHICKKINSKDYVAGQRNSS